MRDLKQLNKLEAYLKANGYYYKRIDKEPSIPCLYGYDEQHQICVYADEDCTDRLWDAICHKGSYGAEAGLLETMGMIEDCGAVTGYLFADDIIERLEAYKAEKEDNDGRN